MTISLGRRRRFVFTLSVVPSTPETRNLFDIPAAIEASDTELERLARIPERSVDQVRWDALATTYGGVRSV